MALVFKKHLLFLFALVLFQNAFAQVVVSVSVKPPFTPFISDYTNPARLQDISVSLFNQSGSDLKLKFKLTLTNQAKGIRIAIKESATPIAPLELNKNEFKFVVLEDVSNLYGKLDQNSFDISGADIQSLILDGTIPDGVYELCLQAYDYDAPGFSKPLSGASPTGCFTFQVNYTDPPTDIRLNNNLLQYSFGGTVPKLGVQSGLGQNYTVQFTPPALNIGSVYEYELMVFSEENINPSRQRENSLLNAIHTIIPLIRKTSLVPFFVIGPEDLSLDYNSNYYLLIKAVDLNEKTLFKNKGFSTFKAFNLVDVQPLFMPAPQFTLVACGREIKSTELPSTLTWSNGIDLVTDVRIKNIVETRIKVVRFSSNVIPPVDIFSSNSGFVLKDTVIRYADRGKIAESIAMSSAFFKPADNEQTRWVLGVHNRVIEFSPTSSFIHFSNSGKAQCEFDVSSAAQNSPARLLLTIDYPINNDTLPFHYPPIVVKTDNLSSYNKVVFTQFNSGLEIVESNKYLKLSTDPVVNVSLNALGLDTALSQVSRLLDQAARLQLMGGSQLFIDDYIRSAASLLKQVSQTSRIQIAYALNSKNLPLGNGSTGKIALLQQLLKYEAAKQLSGNQSVMSIPNIKSILYTEPYRNQVLWTGRVGVYSDNVFYNPGMSLADYEHKFRLNSFTTEDLDAEMLKQGLKSASGSFSVGMKTPQIRTPYKGRKLSPGNIAFSFLSSPKPIKLLPTADNNDAWREFEFLSVSQQWNLELSRDVNFRIIDTVISHKIVKNYDIRQGSAEILADLYKEVSLSFKITKPAKYYWRVTWSNVTLDDNNTAEEKAYYSQLGNLLAASQLLGEDVNTDSMFLIRKNYRFSSLDSFVVEGPKLASLPAPNYELVYPLNGDTIPFLYPPIVVRSNRPDTAYKFVLSKFNSNLEPFKNHNYYILDTLNGASKRLMQMSYDSSLASLQRSFDGLAKQQLSGDMDASSMNPMVDAFLAQTQKQSHLRYFKTPNSSLLVLGNSPTGKLKLSILIADRNAAVQETGNLDLDPEVPNFGQLVYKDPYKEIVWNSRFAYFSPKGEKMSIDSFENLFSSDELTANSGINANNQQGLGTMNGRFSVGMKIPEIQALSGAVASRKNIKVRFKPSLVPSKIFPETDNNEAWAQWQDLLVAQQWNIEVSKSPSFDSLVFRRSKCIIETYSMPGGRERLMNDLYNTREETFSLDTVGKYYYRITWSNPTDIDTNNALHLRFFEYQNQLMAQNQLTDGIGNADEAPHDFGTLLRKNYKFSYLDSFNAVDSNVLRDTALCGLACQFNMGGVNMTPQTAHIRVGELVRVGQFEMKIKTITFNPVSKTAVGTGSIRCSLFPGPISVVFSQVKFNAEKRLIEGTVKAKTKTDDLIAGYTGGSTSMFEKIFNKYIDYTVVKNQVNRAVNNATEGEIDDLYSYINSPACLVLGGIFGEEVTMPFGLSKEVDNFPHTIAVTDVFFTPTEAKISAAAILRMTYETLDQYVGFGASDICLTPKGLAQTLNGGALELMGSIDFKTADSNVFKILGRQGDANGNDGQSGTRLVWDCNGFKHIDLKASLELSRDLVLPVVSKKPGIGKVTATGHAVISSLNNWMLSLSFDKSFQLKSLPGFVITCRQATLDFSDQANAQGMVFPNNYLGVKDAHWKGVYFQEIGLRLPDAFSEKDTVNGLNINARNLILDAAGITASIGIENVLSLNNGSLSGWKYSIDSLSIDLVNNVPRTSKLSGQISVPILAGNLVYRMMLSPSRNADSLYAQFGIRNVNAIDMPAWFASLSLLASSRIDVLGDITRPQTLALQSNFNGSITLGAADIAGLKEVRLGTLPFEGLKVKTSIAKPLEFKVTLDKLGGMDMNRVISNTSLPSNTSSTSTTPLAVSGQQKTGGFPINISDIGMDAFSGKCTFDLSNEAGPRIGLTFKITVNVVDLGNNSIGGSCKLGIYAAPKSMNSLWEFKPAGLNVDTIHISAFLNGAIKVAGGITFISNDPVYGNGIAGFLFADIKPSIAVGVTGMFGEVNGMRYWMFGAFAKINPGIPIDFSANVLYANSISAEAWYKMRRTSGDATAQSAGFQIGRSPSGASFVPEDSLFFGFGAALGLTGPSGAPLFGDVGLYATINNQGGLSLLTMEGNIWMTNDDKASAPVLVNCNATIDIDNEMFNANLTALVNVGNGVVKGRTPVTDAQGRTYYQAGSGNLFIDSRNKNWHIKLGNPFVTDGKLGFGFFAGSSEIFKAGGYFMMGNHLPQNLPPMDPELVKKLVQSNISVPSQRTGKGSSGFAISMGIDASIPEKQIELGVFYAGLSVQFAVDGMLSAKPLNCNGRDGMKGWYLNGTAYAVVKGALGMHIDMPMYKGDIIAVTLNAGMLLDAGLPNPYYFRGQFSANFSVLGGLIEVNKRVEFELAEDPKCKPTITKSNIGFGSIVSDSKPTVNSTNVSVGVEPNITLNFALDKITKYDVPKPGSPSTPVQEKIRVRKEYIKLIESNNKNRKINILFSSDSLSITIRPDSFLKPGITSYVLSAKFVAEKYNLVSKKWEKILKSNRLPWDTTLILPFTTELMASINDSNMSYSTPLAGENYFKKGDFSSGKLVLKQNDVQNTFFTGTLHTASPYRDFDLLKGYYVYYGLFASAGDPSDTVRVGLSFFKNEVRYNIPPSLVTGKLYQFRIVREKVPGTNMVRNNSLTYLGSQNTFQMRRIEAADKAELRAIVYSFNFKVSKYNTIVDKIQQLKLNSNSYYFYTNDTIRVIAATEEPFEEYEVKQYKYPVPSSNIILPAPMVLSCSNNVTDDNQWMVNDYRPKVYKAGDSLQRKRPNLSAPFIDRTKNLEGVVLNMNEHIFKPLPSINLLFNYDFRLVNLRLNTVSSAIASLDIARLSGNVFNIDLNSDQLSLNTDGTIGSGSFLTSSTSTTNTATPPVKPALGTQLHINYFQYKLIYSDFTRLKSLANAVVAANPTLWFIGLTTAENALVTRIKLNTYTFVAPFNNNKFAIAFHKNSNNNSPQNRLYINSTHQNFASLSTIVTTTTTTTARNSAISTYVKL
jgi:hypothetical protein